MNARESQKDETPNPKCSNIFDGQITAFESSVESFGLDKTFRRHGFALFHSLPAEKRILYQEEMGLVGKDANSQYNLGVAYAADGLFEKAIACWKDVLKNSPDILETSYNIALASERLGDISAARKYYEHYIKAIEKGEESQAIEEHLARLGQ